MGLEDEDEEYPCRYYPATFSPHTARAFWSQHSGHSCATGAAARAVIDGARNRGWADVAELVTPQDWVHAYRARNVPATLADGRVELVADTSVTAVMMPHALAARAHDRLESQAPILAPSVPRLATSDWAILARPELIPAEALHELCRWGVRVLQTGQRLGLPASSPAELAHESWWFEWPQQHVRYAQLLGAPSMMLLLNTCFEAAHSDRRLSLRGTDIVYEVPPNRHLTAVLTAEAAAGFGRRARTHSRSVGAVASLLITVGSRVLDAGGDNHVLHVLVKDEAGREHVVDIGDLMTADRQPQQSSIASAGRDG